MLIHYLLFLILIFQHMVFFQACIHIQLHLMQNNQLQFHDFNDIILLVPYNQVYHLYLLNYLVSIYVLYPNLLISNNLLNQILNFLVLNLYVLFLMNVNILMKLLYMHKKILIIYKFKYLFLLLKIFYFYQYDILNHHH